MEIPTKFELHKIEIDYIIKRNPTLVFFLEDAKIDVFNSHQVNVRCVALKLALFEQIDSYRVSIK